MKVIPERVDFHVLVEPLTLRRELPNDGFSVPAIHLVLVQKFFFKSMNNKIQANMKEVEEKRLFSNVTGKL